VQDSLAGEDTVVETHFSPDNKAITVFDADGDNSVNLLYKPSIAKNNWSTKYTISSVDNVHCSVHV